jgi:hypothetical protein
MRLHPTGHRRLSTLDQLADIPEEEIWLQKQKSARIRRVYQLDVQHFVLRCPSPRRPSSTHPVSRNKIRNLGDTQVIGRGASIRRRLEHLETPAARRAVFSL